MIKLQNIRRLLLVTLVFYSHLVNAQTPFPDDTLDNPVPFDGWVVVIIAVIIAFCLKKANDLRKARKL